MKSVRVTRLIVAVAGVATLGWPSVARAQGFGATLQAAPPSQSVTAPPSPSQPPPPAQASAQAGDERARQRQAYLRYIEAQRLKTTRPPRINEAIAAFKEVIQLDPTACEPHADLGEMYFYQSRRDAAEKEGLEAIRLDPDCLSGHKLLARLYVFAVRIANSPSAASLDRAIRAYEEVARLDSTSAEAWAFIADLSQMKGDLERQTRALEKLTGITVFGDTFFYRQLMNNEPSLDQAYYQLSQLYLRQGKNEQAADAARRAYELDLDSSVNVRNLINVLRLAGNSERELQTYARLSRTANSPVLQIGYGAALVRVGRYAEAVERLRAYLKGDPANAAVVEMLAAAERRAGRRDAAVETLKQGMQNSEPSARLKLALELGQTYEEMGRGADALAQYESLFNELAGKGKLEQQYADVFSETLSRLARAYDRAEERKKLQALLTRARQVTGESSPLVDALAVDLLREDGKPREALELLRAATRRFPEDRSLRLTEALILGDLNHYGESVELLRDMLRGARGESSGDVSIHLILSSQLMQSGQLKEAEATVRKALELNPHDSDLLIQLSSILDRAGRFAEAEKTLRSVLRREPDNATALNNLGYHLIERGGRYTEALALIEKAVSIEPLNGSFLDSLGWVNYKLGRLQEARGHLEKASSYARRNSTIHEHLGDVLRDLGRIQDARRQWERALERSLEAGAIARLKDKLKNAQ
jgi:tetratricopeptide (TPR) repeat protein